ncbi:MAG: N-acetyltransferase [Planctomycetes bacterium]|nr:N-acetyltransferase [Planctomycetota bacterium]
MIVRLARDTDIPAITGINDWYIARTAANFHAQPTGEEAMLDQWRHTRERYPWLVAEASGAVIGFARASPWKGRCAYDWSAEVTVYVHHEHHRKGAGAALYVRLFEILRNQGYRTVLAGITQPNQASVRLHERMGMTKVGHMKRVGWKFQAWHDVGYWQLELVDDDAAPHTIKRVSEVCDG